MTEPTDLRTLPNGQVLSDYRIEGVLGQGGFGITYLATDTNLGRKVAIKEYLPREFAARDSTLTIRATGNAEDRETFNWELTRFLEEARILARFEHPNIVAVRRCSRRPQIDHPRRLRIDQCLTSRCGGQLQIGKPAPTGQIVIGGNKFEFSGNITIRQERRKLPFKLACRCVFGEYGTRIFGRNALN